VGLSESVVDNDMFASLAYIGQLRVERYASLSVSAVCIMGVATIERW